jgi:hypothetical protein
MRLHHTEVARTPYHTDYTGSPTCSNEEKMPMTHFVMCAIESMDQKFTRQGQKGPIQYLVASSVAHCKCAYTTPKWQERHITRIIPGPRLAAMRPEIHTAGSKGTNPIPRGRYLHCCKSGTRYNPCDNKTPSNLNRQRDALRLLSLTANAPTPHRSGKNAIMCAIESMDQKFTRQGQKGPIQYLVGDIFIAASRGPHDKMSHRHFLADTSYPCFVWIG